MSPEWPVLQSVAGYIRHFGLSFLIISAMHPVVFWHYINPSIFIIIISCNFKVLVNSSIVLFLGGFCTKDLLLLLLLRHF